MNRPALHIPILAPWILIVIVAGCGTTKNRTATQQLLLSDAVDHAVASIDFRPLSGRKVFFDTSYVAEVKDLGFVNSNYIVSSLRQQMVAARCLLQEKPEDADFIVEARVGTVGTDSNEIVYGIPANNGLSTAASLMPNSPPIPTLPEISVARKNTELGAAKIAVFAYHRQTRSPVWQSGIARASSNSQDLWLLGAGPFQRGSIHDGTRFAGQALRLPLLSPDEEEESGPLVAYFDEHLFPRPRGGDRVANQRGRRVEELIESLPTASVRDWLKPLEADGHFPMESELLRR